MLTKTADKDRIPKRLLNVAETASYLGISPRTIYNGISRKAKKGEFPIKPKRIGRAVRFDINDLDEFINSN